MRLTRRDLLQGSVAVAALSAYPLRDCWGAETKIDRPLEWGGVNLAGAEFGNVPGRCNIDYIYPREGDVAYFSKLGFNCFRVPFRWERLQPSLEGDFATDEMAQLAHLVGEITRRGHTAILDPHNYAKRRIAADGWANEHVIGSIAVPIRAFEDFWRRLASAFKSNDRVVFGLMNEPYGLSAAAWLEIANRAIAAIRGSGAGNLMTVPGRTTLVRTRGSRPEMTSLRTYRTRPIDLQSRCISISMTTRRERARRQRREPAARIACVRSKSGRGPTN